ncbi:MAG: ABC transporter permease [Leptolyngbyaceae bacterium]|nr:ABC transporter permease [Leptolyngbyaceae bacterium]
MSIAPFDFFQLTVRTLLSNPLRSSLTSIGVFMGVAAVMSTLQVGAIGRNVISNRLAEREAPQVSIYPQRVSGASSQITMTADDLQFLEQRLPSLQAISSVGWIASELTIFQGNEAYPSMLATTEHYLSTSGRQILQGRFFSPSDFDTYRPVVVIDEQLLEQLADRGSLLNRRIYINQQPFIVVGIIESSLNADNPNDGELLMPMSIYHALWGQQRFNLVNLRPTHLDHLEELGSNAEALLMQRFPGQSFWVWNNVEDILEQKATLNLASRALAVVGAIALIVGGVGIANIMIASTTERIAEIGIRRAVGATQQEILVQFISEAVILSVIGGVSAILAVHGLTTVVAQKFDLPYTFDAHVAGIALSSAVAVGVGSSFFPALQASRLDPAKALRSS